jgi:hypothetical protein
VGSYRFLLEIPAMPRMLQMLLDSGGEREEAALLASFGDREGAEAALARLVKHKLVSRCEGMLSTLIYNYGYV